MLRIARLRYAGPDVVRQTCEVDAVMGVEFR